VGGKWRRTRGLRSRNLRSAAASNPIATALCRRMRRWTAMSGRELHEDSWAEHQRVGPRASCPAKPRPRDRARPAGRTADTVRRAERSGPRASARFGSGRQRSQLRRGRGRQQRLLRSEYGGRHARAVRVVRRGGRVVVTAWGPPEKREFLRAVMPALGPLMPPPPPGATPRIQGRCLNRERWRAFSKRQACASWRRARSPVPLSSQAPRHRGAETPALGSTKTQFTRLSCALYHGDCGGPIGKPTPIPDPITLTKYLE
jgi:hypothetical protein